MIKSVEDLDLLDEVSTSTKTFRNLHIKRTAYLPAMRATMRMSIPAIYTQNVIDASWSITQTIHRKPPTPKTTKLAGLYVK